MSDTAMSPSEGMEWNGATTCWIYHHPPCYILSMGRMKCATLEFLSFPPPFQTGNYLSAAGEKKEKRGTRDKDGIINCVSS